MILTKESSDDLESFKLFFKNSDYSEEVLTCAYNSMSNNGKVNLSEELGGVFLDMKNAIVDAKKLGYPKMGEDIKGASKNYNCWGTCIALTKGNNGVKEGDGILRGEDFDNELQRNYTQVEQSQAVVGKSVLRYADKVTNSMANGHGAIYMGQDNNGQQYVFSKNGWYYMPSIYEKSVVDALYPKTEVRGFGFSFTSGFFNLKK